MGDFNSKRGKLIYTSIFIAFTAFITMIVSQAVGQILSSIIITDNKTNQAYFSNVFGELIAFVAIFVIAKFFLEIEKSYLFKNFFKALLLISPMIIVIFLNGSQYLISVSNSGFNLNNLLKGLIVGFLVGLFEEFAYRKTVITYLMRENKGINYLAIVFISGLIFSLVHIINIAQSSFQNTLVQLMYAFGIGTLFGAVFILTKNILVPIIFHGLTDAFSFAANPESNLSTGDSGVAIETWILFGTITVVFVLFSIFYLRSKNKTLIDHIWS